MCYTSHPSLTGVKIMTGAFARQTSHDPLIVPLKKWGGGEGPSVTCHCPALSMCRGNRDDGDRGHRAENTVL